MVNAGGAGTGVIAPKVFQHKPDPNLEEWVVRFDPSVGFWTIRRRGDHSGRIITAENIRMDCPAQGDAHYILANGVLKGREMSDISSSRAHAKLVTFLRKKEDAYPGRPPYIDPMLDWTIFFNENTSRWTAYRRDVPNDVTVTAKVGKRVELNAPFESNGKFLSCHGEMLVRGRSHTKDIALVDVDWLWIRKLTVYKQVVKVPTIKMSTRVRGPSPFNTGIGNQWRK